MFRSIAMLSLLLLLASCSGRGTGSELSYRVVRKAFGNILRVEGTVQPVRSTALTVEPVPSSGITVAFLVEDGTFVQAGEVVCVLEALELSSQYDELLIEIEEARASLNRTRASQQMEYALLEAQVKTNEAQTQIAQLDSAQLAYVPPNQRRIIELELESARIERRRLREKLEALKVIQATDLMRREYQIQRRVSRAEQIEHTLEALTMRAPYAGLALRAESWETGEMLQVGDVVYDGQPVLSLPAMEEMKVLIRAREGDYKYMSVGDSVNYTFGAMPGVAASGRIRMKAPVGQPVRRGREQTSVKVFDVEATVAHADRMPEPGFSADCYITLQEVPDTIVVPQVAVFTQDSIKVVYLRRGKRGVEMRQVITGDASAREVIVAQGLREGEEILLVRPEQERVKMVTLLPVADTVAVDY